MSSEQTYITDITNVLTPIVSFVRKRQGFGQTLVPVNDVAYLRATSKVIEVKMANGDMFIIENSLVKLAPRLPSFLRVHRSHIVNPVYIRRVRLKKDQMEVCVENQWLAVGKEKKGLVRKYIRERCA